MPVTGDPSSSSARPLGRLVFAMFVLVLLVVLFWPRNRPTPPPEQAPPAAPVAPEPPAAEPPPPAASTLSGTVTYRQRIALPPEATVTVRLEDTSLADAPATVVAETSFAADGRQVPLPFAIDFDPAAIVGDRTYSARATITVDGELRWTTTTAYHVLTRGNPTRVDLVLDQVNVEPPAPPPAAGVRLRDTEWSLVELDGRAVPPPVEGGREPVLVFQTDRSAVSAQGQCNRHSGTYETAAGEADDAAGTITIALIGSTRMACPEPVMQDEAEFLASLGRVKTFAIEGETLTLGDGTRPTARFAARYSNK
jgi:putative lipoprotein